MKRNEIRQALSVDIHFSSYSIPSYCRNMEAQLMQMQQEFASLKKSNTEPVEPSETEQALCATIHDCCCSLYDVVLIVGCA